MSSERNQSELRIFSTQRGEAVWWQRLLARMKQQDRDIHFTVEYARAYERSYGCKALLAVYGKEDRFVLMPFVLRDVRKLPFMAQSGLDGPVYDVTSMYTFGGPLACLGEESQNFMHYCFQRAFAEYCLANRIVTQFTSFHPLLENHRGPQSTGLVEVKGRKQVVWVDLRGNGDTLLSTFARNHRRSIAHARQLGVVARPQVPNASAVGEFAKLYSTTMRRLGASDRWTLPDSYLDDFIACLGPDRISFFNAEYEGSVFASALVLLCDNTAYHHFIGSREDGLRMCTNHLLVYELCLWAKARGCSRLFLGGGFEPEDGIFRFKAGFSRERAWLYTANAIYDEPLYRQLCEARELWDRAQGISSKSYDFFPAYRR